MQGPRRDDNQGPLDRVRWLLTTDHETVSFVREVLGSVLAVLFVGALLFGVSGVWPPMVAIESASMEPNIRTGDLVFVMDEHRLAGPDPIEYEGESTGVVPSDVAADRDYHEFGQPGDVIIYAPNGRTRSTPIIHRAQFWVDDNENWYDRANPDWVGDYRNCDSLPNCPAPHAGFITKGDNEGTNDKYDQVSGISEPVRPSWIVGTAEFRIPYLGYVRLLLSGTVAADTGPVTWDAGSFDAQTGSATPAAHSTAPPVVREHGSEAVALEAATLRRTPDVIGPRAHAGGENRTLVAPSSTPRGSAAV